MNIHALEFGGVGLQWSQGDTATGGRVLFRQPDRSTWLGVLAGQIAQFVFKALKAKIDAQSCLVLHEQLTDDRCVLGESGALNTQAHGAGSWI
jgi:hypothetical protein